MKSILHLSGSILTALSFFFSSLTFAQYTTCAAASSGAAIGNNACLTNQNATTAVAASNCTGGFNSGVGFFYKFVAGSCPQFDVTFNAGEEVQFRLYNSSCTLLAVECSEAQANIPLSESYSSATGSGPALVSGTTYIIEIVTKTVSNFSICYNANTPEAANNECSGASGLSPTGGTYYNGGNCAYTGSYNDPTTSDPPAATLCAGSLENTQWVTFQPLAGSTSLQIIGSSIACGGPVCAWQFGLFSGSCASLTPEGCISNGNSCTNGPDPSSSSTNPAGGNNTYLLTWNAISATSFTGTITRNGGLPFTGTELFYFVMDGNANSDCQYTLTGINIQVLPIELISFSANQFSNANKIVWEVASEKDNDYFTVERSLDGIQWDEVQRVSGQGTGGQKRYAIMDFDFQKTVNYYRLRQTDYDGEVEFSKVITVDNSSKEKVLLKSVNLMGQEITTDYHGIAIDLFSDGTSEKRMVD